MQTNNPSCPCGCGLKLKATAILGTISTCWLGPDMHLHKETRIDKGVQFRNCQNSGDLLALWMCGNLLEARWICPGEKTRAALDTYRHLFGFKPHYGEEPCTGWLKANQHEQRDQVKDAMLEGKKE